MRRGKNACMMKFGFPSAHVEPGTKVPALLTDYNRSAAAEVPAPWSPGDPEPPTATKVPTTYMDQPSASHFTPRVGTRNRRNSREAPGEGTVADVLDLVHHEGHSAELSPRRRPGLARLGGGDPRVLAPGGPDLARLLHPLAEVGVDLLVIRLRRHGGGG